MRLSAYRDDHPGWQRVQAGLGGLRDELAQRGIRVAVVLYPFLVREGRHLTSHAAFEIMRAFCDEQGILCFDAEPAFLAADVDELRAHPQDYHANSEGNRILAHALAQWLIAGALVE
jgi:DNA-binding transcriptional LysR family regulator